MRQCPICGAEAAELPREGDVEGYDCPTDGKFKIAGTMRYVSASGATWEAALKRAKARTPADTWPTITADDM